MEIDKAFRIRLYPTNDQEALLARTFGCKRFIWNQMLAERKRVYQELKDDTGALHAHRYMTENQYKQRFPFLKDPDSIILQQARVDLQVAFNRFFDYLARYPQFKSRKGRQSCRTMNVNKNIKIDFTQCRLLLPKLGWIAFRDNRVFTERIRSVTVSKTKTGKYHASILVKLEINVEQKTTVNESKIAAFDMSARDFLVSEQERYENPRFYRNSELRLKRLHRRMSRKTKESSNRDKARHRLARLYEMISNRRADWLQKLSTVLANEYDAIIIEDLNIEGMKRWNGGLAKSVTLDFSWDAFKRMLAYKLEWRGKHLVMIDRFFPSSKMCSICGFVNDALTLDDREWICPSCGTMHDRDVNAAINIKREGMKILHKRGITVITIDTTAGTAGSHARGDRVRPATTAATVSEPGIHGLKARGSSTMLG